ncbi:MAG TPA: hypothetical protein VEC17_01570 [Candidatus Binatia bacterium]|nr:hypothetical protein [Candidatus Binatia bacterium]
MPEINLLQNKLNDNTDRWQKSGKAVNVVLVLIIVAEIIGGGAFYMMNKTAQENKLVLDQENLTIKQDLAELQNDLKDATGLQAQTKNIDTLLKNHVVWNAIIQEISDKTYRNSQYMQMTSDTTGRIHIEGMVSSYTDLGKMLLALNTSDKFDSVQLTASSPGTGGAAGILYAVEVKAKQSIFLESAQ